MIEEFPGNNSPVCMPCTGRAVIIDIVKAIEKYTRILISAHVRLDGDAIGSEIAMYHVLKNLGKEPCIVNDSSIPRAFTFLPETTLFDTSVHSLRGNYELIIVLDSPAPKRLGKISSVLSTGVPVINIDHHVSNSNFGNINLIYPDSSSTGEVVLHFLKETSQKITPEIATALYVAIITDTGRFTNSNTTPESLRAAAYLIDCGANPVEIAKYIYKTNTHGQILLHALTTKTMRLDGDGRIAIVHLTREMMKTTQTPAIDTQEFSEIPASVEGVMVGILLKEMDEPNMVKVSLRSNNSVGVNKVAQKFGGGGHEHAAGCELPGSIANVEKMIVEEIKNLIFNCEK